MPEIVERLRIIIDSVAAGAVRDAEQLGAAYSKVGVQTDAMNAKAAGASSGFAGLHGVALRAAGAIAIGGAAAFKAASEYADLGEEVRRFRDISGTSAEVASRWVAVMGDFGIASSTGAKALQLLARDIEDGAGKLTQFGVKVVYAKDGSVDLQGTVENVAEAFRRSHDPAERQAMLLEIFGKKGAELIPILEGGRKGLRDMFAEVPHGQILSDDDLNRAREFKLAMDDLQDSFQEIVIAIGRMAAPALAGAADLIAGATRGLTALDDALGVSAASGAAFGAVMGSVVAPGVGTAVGAIAGATLSLIGSSESIKDELSRELTAALGRAEKGSREYEAALHALKQIHGENVEATRAQEEGERRLAAELESATSKATALKQAIDALTNQSLGYIGATLNTQQALAREAEARTRLAAALAEHGEGSQQVASAQRDLEQAQLAVATSVIAQDAAFEKLRAQIRNGEASIDDIIAKLEREKQLHPEAAAAIDVQIWKLAGLRGSIEQLPAEKRVKIDADDSPLNTVLDRVRARLEGVGRSSAAPGIGAPGWSDIWFESGGLVNAPKGTPVPAVVHGGEYILDADTVERITRGAPSRGAPGATFTPMPAPIVNVHVDPITPEQMEALGEVIAAALARRPQIGRLVVTSTTPPRAWLDEALWRTA